MTLLQLLLLTGLCYAYAVLDAAEWLKGNLVERPNLGHYEFIFEEEMWFENGTLVRFVAADANNPWLKLLTVTGTFAVVGTYSTVAVLCLFTVRALEAKKQQMSGATRRMQRSMTRMMYMQALLPLFTVFLPLFTIFSIMTLRLDAPRAGLWISICLSWVPLTGPISVIVFIRPFNARLKSALLRRPLVRHAGMVSMSEQNPKIRTVSDGTSGGVAWTADAIP